MYEKPRRGPKSPEGKAVASLNATKHGAYSKRVLLQRDDPEEFASFAEGLRRAFAPANEAESFVVEDMIAHGWRMLHEREARTAAMDSTYAETYSIGEGTPAERRLRSIVAAADNGFTDSIARQGTRDERAFYKALEQLKALQAERLIGFPLAPGIRISIQLPHVPPGDDQGEGPALPSPNPGTQLDQ